MSTAKTFERRLFLTSAAATVVANVAGCGDDDGGTPGGVTDAGNIDAGGSDAGGSDASAGVIDASIPTDAGSATNETSTTLGPDAAPTSSDGPASSGGTGPISETSSPSLDASTSGATSGANNSSQSSQASTTDSLESSTDTFEGGGTDGGLGDDAGAGVLCSTNTSNGDHSHPLEIPQDDIESGFGDKTYLLEDGGTGHTHTVTITAYDFLFLQAGTEYPIESTTDAGHSHTCLITCPV
jgi:hypothetical protein